MALRLGCTVKELFRRMDALEFAEWQIILEREELLPHHDRMRHADTVTALRNGPLTRKDKRLWSLSDVAPGNPWQPAPAAAPADAKAPKLSQAARMRAAHSGGRARNG